MSFPLEPNHPDLIKGLRMAQLSLGDIGAASARGTLWEGYTARTQPPAHERREDLLAQLAPLRRLSSHKDAAVNREILRTLAMLGAEAPAKLPERWTASSDPIEDIHELAVWARCTNADRATAQVAGALLNLDRKIVERKLNRDSHWPLRVTELYAGLAEKDDRLPGAIVQHADFGRPDHALFVPKNGEWRVRAAAKFLARLKSEPGGPVTEAMLELLHALPADEVAPAVRPLWGQAGQDAAVVALLARRPAPGDRAKFIDGLASPQLGTVAICLKALDALSDEKSPEEVFALIRVLPQLTEKNVALRGAVTRRLARQTGLPANSPAALWIDWLAQHDGKLAQRLTNPDGVDVAAWTKRLERIDWSRGDGDRGQAVFLKASCAACHSGNQATGPDLKGVSKRFARHDLFTAIVQPSKEVPARYQLTQVETASGKLYQGTVIYDAVDSLILQTGAVDTVRLAGAEIGSRRPLPRSLMPPGLLDGLADGEIADLDAFLRRMQ